MGREIFEDRKRIFKETIMSIGNLPRTWMFKFEDGEDQRIWFDKLLKTEEYKDYITKGKTERLCVKEAVKLAEEKGFKNLIFFPFVLLL